MNSSKSSKKMNKFFASGNENDALISLGRVVDFDEKNDRILVKKIGEIGDLSAFTEYERSSENQGEIDFCEIDSVEILRPSAFNFVLDFPLQNGDLVLLIAIDLIQNEKILREAIGTENKYIAIPIGALGKKNTANKIKISKDGTIEIIAKKSIKLSANSLEIFKNQTNQIDKISKSLAIIASSLASLSSATVLTALGPQPLSNAVDLAGFSSQAIALNQALIALKTKFDMVI